MEPPKKLITKIVEFTALCFLSACLLNAAVNILIKIWPALFIISVIILAVLIIWRILKHRKDLGKW